MKARFVLLGCALLGGLSACVSRGDTVVNSEGAGGAVASGGGAGGAAGGGGAGKGGAGSGGGAVAGGAAGKQSTGGAAGDGGASGVGGASGMGGASGSGTPGGSGGAGGTTGAVGGAAGASGVGGAAGAAGAGASGGAGGCSADADCSDGVACTSDTCSNGACVHAPQDAMCDDKIGCTDDVCGATGCTHTPQSKACGAGSVCIGSAATQATGCCADADADGHAATTCGGDDCNDADGKVFPGAIEACGGPDLNCNPAPGSPAMAPPQKLTTSAGAKQGLSVIRTGAGTYFLAWLEDGRPFFMLVAPDGSTLQPATAVPGVDGTNGPTEADATVGVAEGASQIGIAWVHNDASSKGIDVSWVMKGSSMSAAPPVMFAALPGASGGRVSLDFDGKHFAAQAEGAPVVIANGSSAPYPLGDLTDQWYFGRLLHVPALASSAFVSVGKYYQNGGYYPSAVAAYTESAGSYTANAVLLTPDPQPDLSQTFTTERPHAGVATDGSKIFLLARTLPSSGKACELDRFGLSGAVTKLASFPLSMRPLDLVHVAGATEAAHELGMLFTTDAITPAGLGTDVLFGTKALGDGGADLPVAPIASGAQVDSGALFHDEAGYRAFFIASSSQAADQQIMTTPVLCQ